MRPPFDFRELQERVAGEIPLSLQVPAPGWIHPLADLYEQVAEASKLHGIPEEKYLPLKPTVAGLQKVLPVEIQLSVAFDPESDPGAQAWVNDVESAARKAALEKKDELIARAKGFEQLFRLSNGQPLLHPRRRKRKREPEIAVHRVEIFVLLNFKRLSAREIRQQLNLPQSLSRQAIESASDTIGQELGVARPIRQRKVQA